MQASQVIRIYQKTSAMMKTEIALFFMENAIGKNNDLSMCCTLTITQSNDPTNFSTKNILTKKTNVK